MVEGSGRWWEGLHPETLAMIFVRIPVKERVRCVALVCKPWMQVVVGASYCWSDIDLREAWTRYSRRPRGLDRVLKKLIRWSNRTLQRLSTYHLGQSGFMSVANCGRSLQVLEIPLSNINDDMVVKYLKELPNLRVLDISSCSNISAKGIAAFGKHCKSLVELKRNIPPPYRDTYYYADDPEPMQLNDSEAYTIANTMPALQRIQLRFSGIGDSGLSHILTKCNSLTHLDIRGCWNVNTNIGDDVKLMCQTLQCLEIHRLDLPHKDYPMRWCRFEDDDGCFSSVFEAWFTY